MYRITFVKRCSPHGTRIVEHGPWQPSMRIVEEWVSYFASLDYPVKLNIERLAEGRAQLIRTVRI
jgi:hypothetical protein